ncbi:SDR family oxidoreductase (plasmid) [Rhizobium rosettiformans]|uniref:SDR family oxidoreductase n=1 Tax=Rhizobium rosettiformans TaxID=1368430 RepID=A0ABX7F482_9HYPH|nr:SDR family oxidoreductase [Rhizobium rosettiformans]QRF54556.1 SDR family oxidoreductase [Rhizobium rosettiformans]
MKTVLITGSSSGFGLEIARHFLAHHWKVVATMRKPDPALLPVSPHLSILPLDVTSEESVAGAVEAAGPIDVLVNNAGIGWMNAFEGTPMDLAKELFETNTIGLMRMTQAVLPHMRENGGGVVINISSSVTLRSLPLLSVYTATKAAVNAFGASLSIELEPFGIRVRTILPGSAPTTSFGSSARAQIEAKGGFHPAYADFVSAVFASHQENQGPKTQTSDVVEAVWRAATDKDCPAVQPAGADAVAWAG